MKLSTKTFIAVPALSVGALSLSVAPAMAEPLQEGVPDESEGSGETVSNSEESEESSDEEESESIEPEEPDTESSESAEEPDRAVSNSSEQNTEEEPADTANSVSDTQIAEEVVIGDWAEVSASGFDAEEFVEISLLDINGEGTVLGEAVAESDGSFSTRVLVPNHVEAGDRFLILLGDESGESISTPITVVEPVDEDDTGENNTEPDETSDEENDDNTGSSENDDQRDEETDSTSEEQITPPAYPEEDEREGTNQEQDRDERESLNRGSDSSDETSEEEVRPSDDYWTEERMEEAEPAPMPDVDNDDSGTISYDNDDQGAQQAPDKYVVDGENREGEEVIISAGNVFGDDSMSAAGIAGMGMGLLFVGGGAYALYRKEKDSSPSMRVRHVKR